MANVPGSDSAETGNKGSLVRPLIFLGLIALVIAMQ